MSTWLNRFIYGQNTLLGETTEKVRKDIRKNSNLSDEALEALMSELHYNMAESERKLGDERKRQALVSF